MGATYEDRIEAGCLQPALVGFHLQWRRISVSTRRRDRRRLALRIDSRFDWQLRNRSLESFCFEHR